jgi:hypothetical protein
MLETFIKNKGSTKTILHNSRDNLNNVYEMEWDADYDGKKANLSLDLYENGKEGHYKVQLDNNDLATLLNIPSIEGSLEQRLKRDFKRPPTPYYEPKIIYLPESDSLFESPDSFPKMDIIHSDNLLQPLTIRKKSPMKLTFTSKKNSKSKSKSKKTRSKRREYSTHRKKKTTRKSKGSRVTF